MKIEGRNVYVDSVALTGPNSTRTKEALALLSSNLKLIDGLHIKKEAKAFMKKVHFFMDWNLDHNHAANYHPYKWSSLESDELAAKKYHGIDIININNYINTTHSNQPYMILHELAHAYHDQVLKYNNAKIQAAYQTAMDSGLYKNVLHFNGRFETKERAYAAQDNVEYFGELTEAYFGRNDFYPYNRKDLLKHDSLAFELMREVWQDTSVSKDAWLKEVWYDPFRPEFNENKYYYLSTRFKGETWVLDGPGRYPDLVSMVSKNGQPTQAWKFQRVTDNSYYFRLTNQGRGIGSSLYPLDDGSQNISLGATEMKEVQYWKIIKLYNGYYRITNVFKGVGKSLDVHNTKALEAQLLSTGYYSGQDWKITETNNIQ